MQMNNKLNHLIWKYPYFLTPNEKHSKIQFILKRFRTGSFYKSIYFMGTFFHNIYVTSMLSVVLKFCSIGNNNGNVRRTLSLYDFGRISIWMYIHCAASILSAYMLNWTNYHIQCIGLWRSKSVDVGCSVCLCAFVWQLVV